MTPVPSAAATASEDIELDNSSFWLGFVGGIVTHDLGHVAMAAAHGQRAKLHAGSIIYPNKAFSPPEAVRVSTAGFQTQWLFSEWSFYALKQEQPSLLDQQHYLGLISAHLAISFAYMAVLKDEPTSDIYAVSTTTGRSRNSLALMALLPALLDTYRLFGTDVPSWVDAASIAVKTGEVGLIWTF